MTENWRDRAACRGLPGELFFPISYRTPTGLAQIRDAKRVCSACPVKRNCLTFITREEATTGYAQWFGIYAGLTPAERYKRLHGEAPSRKQLQTADLAAAA